MLSSLSFSSQQPGSESREVKNGAGSFTQVNVDMALRILRHPMNRTTSSAQALGVRISSVRQTTFCSIE
jgi:hypothetical protein